MADRVLRVTGTAAADGVPGALRADGLRVVLDPVPLGPRLGERAVAVHGDDPGAARVSGEWVEPLRRWVADGGASGVGSVLVGSRDAFRQELGLPTDRPIVMGGHQAALWHPGILAKLLAMRSAADVSATGCAVAWVVVDQDDPFPVEVEIPAFDPEGRLRRVRWSVVPGDGGSGARNGSVPGCVRGAFRPRAPVLEPGWALPDGVRERISRAMDAMERHADAPSAASQLTEAVFELLLPVLGGARPVVVPASLIAQTELFARAIEAMRRGPRAVHSSYNEAVAAFPEAGMRALGVDAEGRLELPVWRLAEDGSRVALTDDALRTTPVQRLLPRGLLMTGLLRLAGCELFVHGTGGRGYEPINDRWLGGGWFSGVFDGDGGGSGGARLLAPFVTATADVRLALGGGVVTEAEAAAARWRAHHARHHPGEVGDLEGESARDRLVREIAAAGYGSAERARLYAALHGVLAAHRRRHAEALEALDAEAAALTRAAGERGVRDDRTWSVVLHDAEGLGALARAVAAEFAGAGVGNGPDAGEGAV